MIFFIYLQCVFYQLVMINCKFQKNSIVFGLELCEKDNYKNYAYINKI